MTGPTALRFGLFLSQARKDWNRVLDEFLEAEELGFDHAWLVDHLVDTDGSPKDGCLEAWTLLAAIAARTTRIRLGVLVSSNTFRHPAILLKEAVTVDHISAGRLVLGIGTGWHEDEHRRYGIDLPPAAERVDRFEEAVEVISLLMAQERTTFTGRHYQLDDAHLEPGPVQQPRIPILIAAHRPRMLRITARYADQWDTFGVIPGAATEGVETDLADRIAALDAACRAIGRDPAEIRRSTWATSEALRSTDAYLDFVRYHHRLGFTDFSTQWPEASDIGVLRRVATEIIPALRAGRLLDS
jgi:alkanesulfonate monooxygenase SsuD/methylene tetrahydromethanopterin reductase-like flavin-dependent oxidoreductase (luciferase family)